MQILPRSPSDGHVVLGIESSCDETGVAVYTTARGLLAHDVFSQVAMHAEYGGVVPELASRDHVRRIVPMVREVLARAAVRFESLDAIAYTAGPGLAGALLVGASVACALAGSLGIPALPIHHLEGHLLSPLLSADRPDFPFVALLVSGGHTQLMLVRGLGDYTMLGETLDDAAGEAFDKTAQLLGLPYPGGPALAHLAAGGNAERYRLPRPMLASGDLDFSFAGLKTAVLTQVRALSQQQPLDAQARADMAASFQRAVVDVLVTKSERAVRGAAVSTLVVAGGVGANAELRARLSAAAQRGGYRVCYPELALCTDNGAMIAYAGALRLAAAKVAPPSYSFDVRPRWDLTSLR